MKKLEAIEKMKEGCKVAHEYFTSDEWIRLNKDGLIEMEDGCVCEEEEFWKYRMATYFEEGWRIVENNK